MPGHKGELGYERDVTEISGADSLYSASGIIRESERLTGELFGAETYFSAEGSSLSIRAMLYLASLYAKASGRKNKILVQRNAHRSFFSAAALIDFEVEFFGFGDNYLSSDASAEELATLLDSLDELPAAVYLTSPDYLGKMQDIRAISEVCRERGILTLVDNAHGAYLAFLEKSLHPIALGADMCADSAHKTLPALTGAAYLHISRNAPRLLSESAKAAMALFGSTSPSYIILESLDRLNEILCKGFKDKLASAARLVSDTKSRLLEVGYETIDGEPMKITLNAKKYGYTGTELGKILEENNIFPEFYDADYLVLMPSALTEAKALDRLFETLKAVEKKAAKERFPKRLAPPKRAMSIREATLAPKETVSALGALGRVLADCSVSCPPAVPILVPGEVVDEVAIEAFGYYGYDEITVVK